MATTKKTTKRTKRTKKVAATPTPTPTPQLTPDDINRAQHAEARALASIIQSPLAYRCEVRALSLKQALEDMILKLHAYQDVGAAKDLNEFVEVPLRTSLDTLNAIVAKLNVPEAFFPAKAEIQRKLNAENRAKEAMETLQKMNAARH
jgi:hypothetical protein